MITASYILKSTVILGIGYAYYWLILRRETAFQLHRAYLLGLVLLGLLLPFLRLPSLPVGLDIPSISTFHLEEVLISADSSSVNWLDILSWIYGIGVGYLAVKWLLQMGHIYCLIIRHKRTKYSHAYLVHTSTAVPISSFFRYIFWHESEYLSPDQRRQLLQHELCHIRDRHSWDIMLVELLLIIFWFQPFLYLLRRSIHQNHEFIADQAGMQNSNVQSYTELILTQLFGQQLSLLHSFFHPPLTLRVTMLSKQEQNKKESKRRIFWKYLALIPVFSGLMVAMSCSPDVQEAEAEVLEQTKIEVNKQTDIQKVSDQGVDKLPKPLNMAEIQQKVGYPKPAANQGLEGRVLIKVLVDKSGKYLRHEIIESPDDNSLSYYKHNLVSACCTIPNYFPACYRCINPILFYKFCLSFKYTNR